MPVHYSKDIIQFSMDLFGYTDETSWKYNRSIQIELFIAIRFI